jgi:flagellar motor switch protein FliN/FliY
VAVPADFNSILKLEVPLIVVIGSRQMAVREVLSLAPGAIVELPKSADDELEILINNKTIGTGAAVKVGENFGVRITYVGNVRDRLNAITGNEASPSLLSDADAAPASASATLGSDAAIESVVNEALAGATGPGS